MTSPGKHYLLLGICKGGRGVQLGEALDAVFPMTTQRRAAGELETKTFSTSGVGLIEACPQYIGGLPLGGTGSNRWDMPNDRLLTVGYIDSKQIEKPGEIYGRAGVFLWDKNGQLLDSKVLQERIGVTTMGPGLFASRDATRSLHDCNVGLVYTGGPWIGFGCDVHFDDALCGEWGRVKAYYTFDASADGKIIVDRDASERGAKRCKPNDGMH